MYVKCLFISYTVALFFFYLRVENIQVIKLELLPANYFFLGLFQFLF